MPPLIKDKLKALPIPKVRTESVWKGPEEDGITFSLLSRFLVCRERFRLLVVEGLQVADHFNPKIEFGSMWHVCEEALAADNLGAEGYSWEYQLKAYVRILLQKYPMDRDSINHWYEMVRAMFPIYVEHWSKHEDVVDRTPLLQEHSFNVPYKLPSGRTVRLRGKWDSVDLIGKGKKAGVWLQENKTKSSIDVPKLTRQLSFDLQTMIYLIAMWHSHDVWVAVAEKSSTAKIIGVRYNVIRRSAHKSVESMLKKIQEDQFNGRIGEWFSRWSVEVRPADVDKFRRQCLDPILENLCDWWGHVKTGGDPFSSEALYGESPEVYRHWRHPFGVYNVLDEGGSSDIDAYLDTGSIVGLARTDNLFPELEQPKEK